MADRYWVGGTADWDGTAGSKWALTSGGAGGQAVPTSSDDVFFTAASGAVTCTIATGNTGAKSITCTGFTGTLASTADITISGNLTLASGMTTNFGGGVFLSFDANATITSAGKSLYNVLINTAGITVSLADAINTTGSFSVLQGTFTTNNFSVTTATLDSNTNTTRVINLGSSTVTINTASGFAATDTTGLTFNAGTSQINFSSSSSSIDSGGGITFYNVSFTSTSISTASISGANTFNNLSFTGRTTAGVGLVDIDSNQTVNGTLTISAGSASNCRTFVRSDSLGSAVTLTCASIAAATDIDFRDITIAGAAAPLSGTRLGDCKGNSGITFVAGKTVYWNLVGTPYNWSDTAWATSSGGVVNANNFPLAQDTAIFEATGMTSGAVITINAAYNIGTLNMSARTANTVTLTSSLGATVYGNWVNGTGVTLTGTGTLTFTGRGSQTITSAGRTFTQLVTVNTPGGSVTLQDAFSSNRSNASAITVTAGTFDANDYNVTLSGTSSGVSTSGASVRTIAIGSGTLTIAGTGGWNAATATNLTVTGTGTISLTSASSKTFAGGGVQTYPTVNQGGAGQLTFSGSNKFANITNTYSATGATTVRFTGATTNDFGAFNLTGESGRVCTLTSSTVTQAILRKPTAWNVGVNSTDGGSNTGLSFTAGGGIDYLAISKINGAVVPSSAFFVFF
jgi:hypothetical protein